MAARKKAASAGTRSGRVSKRTRGKLAPGGEARGLDAAQVAIALESPEIADLAALVRRSGAEVGLAVDPDVDRLAIVDETVALTGRGAIDIPDSPQNLDFVARSPAY